MVHVLDRVSVSSSCMGMKGGLESDFAAPALIKSADVDIRWPVIDHTLPFPAYSKALRQHAASSLLRTTRCSCDRECENSRPHALGPFAESQLRFHAQRTNARAEATPLTRALGTTATSFCERALFRPVFVVRAARPFAN